MNQQLLNINTVINPSITNNPDELDNPIRLEKITSIVNNNNLEGNGRGQSQDTNITARYQIIRYLGQGIHGNLYLAKDSNDDRVICKEIQLDADPHNNAIQTRQLEFELNILKYLSSNSIAREHINPCLDYKIHNNHIYTIFPVFKGYSLGHFYGFMRKLPAHEDYYKIAFYLVKSLLHALAKIHDTGIAHQNITPDSVLVSTFIEPREIKVKLTDFGLGCGNPKSLLQYQHHESNNKIGNCHQNGHAPVKYLAEVLAELKDSDYLKISQKYDVLCLGLIITKFLLFFDAEIVSIIDSLLGSDKMDNRKLGVLRDKIKRKYFDNKSLMDILTISSGDKKILRSYLKHIWQYMLSPTIKRKSAQYVVDKIIIYEKYKNDIF